MIVNFEILKKTHLTDVDFMNLLRINNKYYEDVNLADVQHLIAQDWLTTIKVKKISNSALRLSKKAKQLLKTLQVVGITDEAQQLFTRIVDLYINNGHESKIGNRRELIRRISWFLVETNFPQDQVYNLIEDYMLRLNDSTYLTKAENLFWKPANLYASKYTLSQSKLYDMYLRTYKNEG